MFEKIKAFFTRKKKPDANLIVQQTVDSIVSAGMRAQEQANIEYWHQQMTKAPRSYVPFPDSAPQHRSEETSRSDDTLTDLLTVAAIFEVAESFSSSSDCSSSSDSISSSCDSGSSDFSGGGGDFGGGGSSDSF